MGLRLKQGISCRDQSQQAERLPDALRLLLEPFPRIRTFCLAMSFLVLVAATFALINGNGGLAIALFVVAASEAVFGWAM
jgi:hypothetical protein